MSRSNRPARLRRRRITLCVDIAVGAAFVVAVIALAHEAHADTETPDPVQDLFGDSGINAWTQDAHPFLDAHPLLATTFDGMVDQFNAADVDPLSDLVSAIDPNAFGPNGLPTDFLGDLAVTLDYGLLAPTGLGALLDPVIDNLLGMGMIG